ncbi:hypothetical protein GWK75_01470 [Candidatus Saccharibacteria bacterium oral taxon 955]|nr:hypothetical protein GWK75_01470 [Candidatus Saccharibacteria bacterium oral taxon 955]
MTGLPEAPGSFIFGIWYDRPFARTSKIAGFCFTVVGALLSYLWFNIYPARFFMGDVGSFAFGRALV